MYTAMDMPAVLDTWAPTTSSKCGTALDRHHGTIPGLWGCVPKCPQASRILITWRTMAASLRTERWGPIQLRFHLLFSAPVSGPTARLPSYNEP